MLSHIVVKDFDLVPNYHYIDEIFIFFYLMLLQLDDAYSQDI